MVNLRDYPEQQKIVEDGSKYKLVVGGRRSGLTTVIIETALKETSLFPHIQTILITTTHKAVVKDIFNKIIDECIERRIHIKYINKIEFKININGVIIYIDTHNSTRLLGRNVDLVCIDNAEYLKEDIWNEVLLPNAMLNDAKILMTFHPLPNLKTPGYLKGLWCGSNGWKKFNLYPVDNPKINQQALEELEQHITSELYNSTIMCKDWY